MNIKKKITRRGLLASGTGLALAQMLSANNSLEGSVQKPKGISVYQAIGVKHVINATGTVTTLGGSLMPSEVVAAWIDASKHFVNLLELQDKVGEAIAKLVGVEAALVTTGAAGALLLGTAAAVAGADAKQIRRLPDAAAEGMISRDKVCFGEGTWTVKSRRSRPMPHTRRHIKSETG